MRMSRWRERHPDLPLEIEASIRVVDLQREGFHAAVRQGKGPWAGLDSERLWEQPPIIIVGSPSAARRLQGAQPEALAREPLLGDDDMWNDWFAAAGLRTTTWTIPVAEPEDARMVPSPACRPVTVPVASTLTTVGVSDVQPGSRSVIVSPCAFRRIADAMVTLPTTICDARTLTLTVLTAEPSPGPSGAR